MNRVLLIVCVSIVGFFSSCSDQELAGDLENMPYEKLSDYGFFEGDMAEMNPSDIVLPYHLNTPLFSDYSEKDRFVYIPSGESATYVNDGLLDFPEGTILVKNFAFKTDLREENSPVTHLETRLLIKKGGEWEPASYLWNSEQTEAYFSVVGRQEQVSWIHYDGSVRSTNYLIPNKNECKGCHKIGGTIQPIGPKTRNLNGDYPYADGSMNQLTKWTDYGFLSDAPDASSAAKAAVWDDPSTGTLEERARIYLDMNCGHCHSLAGPANNSGMFLDYETTDLYVMGVCKVPIAAGVGSGGLQYGIVPGDPAQSIMIYRMNSTVIDVAMPELARSVIHDEGLQLISDWIASLPGDCN